MRDPIQQLERKQWVWRLVNAISTAVGLMFCWSLLKSGMILAAVLLALLYLGVPMYLEYVWQRQIRTMKRVILDRLSSRLCIKDE